MTTVSTSVPTLKDICLQTLVTQIMTLPPLLQESIAKRTIVSMKEEAEKEVTKEVYENVKRQLPDIVEDEVMYKRRRLESYRGNYEDDGPLVDIAETIATKVVQSEPQQYFGTGHPRDYDYDYESEPDYDYPDEPDYSDEPDSEDALF